MTGEATSEAPAGGPEEMAAEAAKMPPAEPSGEGAAAEPTGEEPAPTPQEPAAQAPAPAAPEPAPPSEDVPSAPLLLAVEDVSDSSVTVSWEPPDRLGRLGLRGYVLELRREGALEWVPVNPLPMMVTQLTVRNLALGDKFFLRVAAVSSAGAGPPAVLDQPVHIRAIVGTDGPWQRLVQNPTVLTRGSMATGCDRALGNESFQDFSKVLGYGKWKVLDGGKTRANGSQPPGAYGIWVPGSSQKEAAPEHTPGPPGQPASPAAPAVPQEPPPAAHCGTKPRLLFEAEAPKIRVPRHLRQTYIRQVGEAVNLQIPFQGNPTPQASWTHNGQALDSQRVNVRTGDRDSILFIRSAQRADSGCYELTVRLEGLEAKAAINILVIEKPGPPSGIRLVDVWGCNAALEWTPPQDTGNTELLGYTVQKADKKTGQWFTVLERYHPTTCTISDLIVGNSYSFRVFSENLCGLSASAAITKELAHIQKADTVPKPKGFVERDFLEAPTFTQPLADHASTPGYSTQLFCSVRASPKPKIIWMKNKMDLQGDPKYRAISEQGVCTLEIRKPCPFDSGVYTCKAVNVLGEASVDCRLEVKGEGSRSVLLGDLPTHTWGSLGHTLRRDWRKLPGER
ncbi:Myosin-binding protein H [Galemys pyrenaicus]|uniref:Myosin-binding protein H n=1 Tax=Galemys pyrenaicus TaxID=202257 RepID=A0A8J6DX34_GALPY|nr:Myosin-binding protein H [Galemys pyrenaicus]